jgi:hypothetical protein
MATDDDIGAVLPDPPPPRPARREQAIGEAMRRFDGAGAAPPLGARQFDTDRAAVSPRLSRGWIGRPQLAALAGVALVVSIGQPVWMSGDHGLSPPLKAPVARPEDSATTEGATDRTTPPAEPKSAAPALLPPEPQATPIIARPPIPSAPAASPSAILRETETASRSEAGSALSAPMAFQQKRAGDDTAKPAAPPPPPPPPPPPAPVIATDRYANDSRDIVVTGSRVRPVRRGDWNACSVDDPKQDLAACRKQIHLGATDLKGQAAVQLGDGLSLAWQGDAKRAIAAFDRAVTLAPRDPGAYFNRGLAYKHSGDLDSAIADLDQAVRLAPNVARYRYNRSLLLRQRGDLRKAEADESRALDLDPSYEAVIR